MAMATTAASVADSAAKKNLEKEYFNIQNVRGNICLIFRKQQYKRWDRVENVPVSQLWYSVGHLSIKLFFLNTLKETFFFFFRPCNCGFMGLCLRQFHSYHRPGTLGYQKLARLVVYWFWQWQRRLWGQRVWTRYQAHNQWRGPIPGQQGARAILTVRLNES